MQRVATIAALGMIATVAGAQPGSDRSTPAPRAQGNGLCRHAPTLAALPPEVERRREQGNARSPEAVPAPVLLDEPPPPPPPAPMVAPPMPAPEPAPVDGARAADKSSADLVVTGSRVGGSARAGSASPATVVGEVSAPRPDRRYGGPQPQAGLLTAGEHDDLLNPELYANYVRRSDLGQRWPVLPVVDTARTLTVAVTDSSGQPMPLADVVLTCADGNSLTLKTLADGTAVFFPALDRLGSSVRLSVGSNGRRAAGDRVVAIPSAPGGQRISVTAAGQATAVGKFDLMLVVDTTGSMGDEISYLQAELRSILSALKATHPQLDMRIALVFYRDLEDDYVTLSVPFSGDIDKTQAVLAKQYANGGGDYPEAVDRAMNRAVNDFEWRPDAVKSMLWVADAPPHDELVGKAWAAAEIARAKRIQIVPVAASGVAKEAEFMMRAMAAATQSRYLFLTDDSGIGLPHNKPAIDCYLVTKLDALVRRVLDSQISGRRIEPGSSEVLRTVGKYDAGKCVLPSGNWQQQD
jgi:hypothetical protein